MADNAQSDTQKDSATESLETKKVTKILLLEDERDAAEIFADLLKTIPLVKVDYVYNGEQALELASKEHFDIILLDILMSGITGLDVLAKLRSDPEKYGVPKIFMLSNVGGDASYSECKKLGANGYILKIKAEPEQIISVVKKVISNPQDFQTYILVT